jgi:TPR repeat protein
MLRNKGDFAQAETNLTCALVIQKKVLGDHRDTALTLSYLGEVLLRQGKARDAEEMQREALRIQKAVLGEYPDQGLSLIWLGDALSQQNRLPEAEAAYRESWQIRRKLLGDNYRQTQDALYGWVQTLRQQGKTNEVLSAYREAAEHGSAAAQNQLGLAYEFGKGVLQNYEDAAKWFQLAANQNYAVAQYNIARLYFHGKGVPKDVVAAANWHNKALERSPDTLNDIAWSLATSDVDGFRDGSNAVLYAEKAVAATSRSNAAFLDTLAAAHAETRRFDKAISTQKEAIALNRNKALKGGFYLRLQLYEGNTPYHESPAATNEPPNSGSTTNR